MDTTMRIEPAFSPAAFAEQVIAAILPLVDPEDRERLRDDVGDTEVYAAVKPIFADYTVEDAVLASYFIRHAAKGEDFERFEAACQARDILQDFICRGEPSSPACASARAYFLVHESSSDTIADANLPELHSRIASDIDAIRENHFRPDQFGLFGSDVWAPKSP
jgi:hypothetical protein